MCLGTVQDREVDSTYGPGALCEQRPKCPGSNLADLLHKCLCPAAFQPAKGSYNFPLGTFPCHLQDDKFTESRASQLHWEICKETILMMVQGMTP